MFNNINISEWREDDSFGSKCGEKFNIHDMGKMKSLSEVNLFMKSENHYNFLKAKSIDLEETQERFQLNEVPVKLGKQCGDASLKFPAGVDLNVKLENNQTNGQGAETTGYRLIKKDLPVEVDLNVKLENNQMAVQEIEIETPDYRLIKRKLSPQSPTSETGTRGDKSVRLECGGASPALKPSVLDYLMQARKRTTSVLVVKKDLNQGRKISTPRRRLKSSSAMATSKQKLISDMYTPKNDDNDEKTLDESTRSINM